MNNKYNSWCKWHPLKTIMLGRSYYPEYYRDIGNPRIKDCLVRIAEETEEDFKNYEKVLTDFGCEVIRPELDPNENIMDYVDDEEKSWRVQPNAWTGTILRPPAQPRDAQLVMGNELLLTGRDNPAIQETLLKYNSTDVLDLVEETRNIIISEDEAFHHVSGEKLLGQGALEFDAPTMTCVGNRVYIDRKEIPKAVIDLLKVKYPDREFIQVKIGGHSDGCFHTLKPGAIISLNEIQSYKDTFPGWDVCYLPDQSWSLVEPFSVLKKKNKGKWWLAGEENNNDFTNFVETWLTDWVGYVEETVFDVNVVMLDDSHVCVSNYNKQVFDFLEKHNIEPIIVPFRHRYFWDGGLHCVTLDLYREGSMENYFE